MPNISRANALGVMAGAALYPGAAQAQILPTKIRLGGLAADTFAEGFYALDLGYFERAGLSVEITPFTNGAVMAAAAAGGSIDIGIADASELANGVLRGLPFLLIAGGALYSSATPTTTLCVAKASPLTRAVELEGQTIAVVSLTGLMISATKAWLSSNGANLDKVRFIEMPFPQMAPALERGTVAAASLSEPLMTGALASTARVFAKSYDAVAKQFLISDWFTTRDWLTNNRDATRRFVNAIYDVARWANTHRDESAAILAKYAKIDLARLDHINRCVYATDLKPALVQPVLDATFKYKSLAVATSASSLIASGY
jgi:NitT/TauT family transport system substrate-binding protein